jgi:hypothetical protein
MHLIGRWERVRELDTIRGFGRGLLLDRKWNTLLPNGDTHEWWRARSGVWHRIGRILTEDVGALRGGWDFGGLVVGLGSEDTSNTFAQTTMNSAYVYGTSGNCHAERVRLPATKTLTDVYYNIASLLGTAANINDISVEVRDDANKPGATLHSSVVHDPSSTTGWAKATGFSQTITGGTLYWIVFGDPDGNGTDRAVVNRTWAYNTNVFYELLHTGAWLAGAFSTNGFSTATISNAVPVVVLVFNDGTCIGFPYSVVGVITTTNLQRGLKIVGGFTEDVKLWGVKQTSAGNNWTGVNVWSGTSGPSGAPTAQATKGLVSGRTLTAANLVGFVFDAPVTLTGGTDYRIVFSVSSNQTAPLGFNIGTGADANLRAAMLGGGNWHHTQEVAGPAWSDDTNRLPGISLLIEDVVAIPAGGGGIKIVGRGGLAG